VLKGAAWAMPAIAVAAAAPAYALSPRFTVSITSNIAAPRASDKPVFTIRPTSAFSLAGLTVWVVSNYAGPAGTTRGLSSSSSVTSGGYTWIKYTITAADLASFNWNWNGSGSFLAIYVYDGTRRVETPYAWGAVPTGITPPVA